MSVINVYEDLQKIRNYYAAQYKALLDKKMKRKVKLVEFPAPPSTTLQRAPVTKERVELKHHPITFTKSKFRMMAEFEYNLRKKGTVVSRDELEELFVQAERKGKGTTAAALSPPKIGGMGTKVAESGEGNKRTSAIKTKKTIRDIVINHKMVDGRKNKTSQQINELVQNAVNELDRQCPQVKMNELTALSIDLSDSHAPGGQKTGHYMHGYQIRNKIKVMISKKVQKYGEKSLKLFYKCDFDPNVRDLAIKDIFEATMDYFGEEHPKVQSEGSNQMSDFSDTNFSLFESLSESSDDQILDISDFGKILDWEELAAQGKILKSYTPGRTMWTNYHVDK